MTQFSGCRNDSKKYPPNVETKTEEVKIITEELAEKGTHYTDSIIERMIKESLPDPIIIDTVDVLNNFECKRQIDSDKYVFNSDTIDHYYNQLPRLNKAAERLFNSSHCFADYIDNSKFRYLILYNQQDESHYSAAFELIQINQSQLTFQRNILAQSYLNEQYEKHLSSHIVGNKITFTTSEIFRYINGIRRDSVSTRVSEMVLD